MVPAPLGTPGSEPRNLLAFAEDHDFAEVLQGEVENYLERLEKNDQVNTRKVRLLRWGARIGTSAR